MSALEELKGFIVDISKEQATPPRPGLVFDRNRHRWIRPEVPESHEDDDFATESHDYSKNDSRYVGYEGPNYRGVMMDDSDEEYYKMHLFPDRYDLATPEDAERFVMSMYKKFGEAKRLFVDASGSFERATCERLIHRGRAIRAEGDPDHFKYYILKPSEPSIPEKDITFSILEQYDTSFSTIRSSSVRLIVNDKEILIGKGIWLSPIRGGSSTDFSGRVMIGPKELIGKSVLDVPELKDQVMNLYNESLKIVGGSFKDAKDTPYNDIIARILYQYKTGFGDGDVTLPRLAEAYIKDGDVRVDEVRDRLAEMLERRDEITDPELKEYYNDAAVMRTILDAIQQNKYDASNVSQKAVDQFKSEVAKTQKVVKEKFPSGKVVLLRGVNGAYAEKIKQGLKEHGSVTIDEHVLTSWTTDERIANKFGQQGIVLKREVSTDDIMFSHFSSPYIKTSDFLFGGEEEGEFIVLNPKHEITIGEQDVLHKGIYRMPFIDFSPENRRWLKIDPPKEEIKKEMVTPPRPGLVFDRQKHRWIRPADESVRVETHQPSEHRKVLPTVNLAKRGPSETLTIPFFEVTPTMEAHEPKMIEWAKSLTPNQRLAYEEWTGSGYTIMRESQIGKSDNPSPLYEKAALMVSDLDSAYETAPVYKGAIYRGMHWLPEDEIKKLATQEFITFDAYTSFSAEPITAMCSADLSLPKELVGTPNISAVFIVVKNNTLGRLITGRGRTNYDYGEWEVLVKKDTTYRVVDRKSVVFDRTITHNNVLYLELEEV